ncbi:Putative salt-induced outer membrane protein [Piscirickettsia salmonis]|uniref:DUF481 domain-containing protein n=1 Tax=Piscirickettsia salmonis TaxID=1238 RepID=UPI0012BAA00D|nr:DUF481 domain-containing protein [Piscirickettsia salmonis]QGP55936.1 Putative salt-induced outer membrane protein [Piscirickettsia salmonis]QGP58194.1 Putative salt-induced outer membrane protein [Piscirickettsia salmonis]QGP65505.1 Putative salt-induced outer membrane protein [Piscirickettsia salmonis]
MKQVATASATVGLVMVAAGSLSFAATAVSGDDIKSLEAKIADQEKALASSQQQLATMKAALIKSGELPAEATEQSADRASKDANSSSAANQGDTETTEKQATAAVAVSRWKGTSLGLGATINTGDNSSQKLNGVLNLKYTALPWEYSAKVDPQYQHSSDQGVSTSKYNVILAANYYFSPKNFIYNNFTYTYDKFDGNDYYWNYSSGYGRTLYQGPEVTITGQVGPGYVQRKIQDSGEVQRLLSLNTMGRLDWQINDKTVFSQILTPVYTTDLTTVTTSTALTTQLIGNLGLQVQFDTKYLSNVTSSARRFTTTTSLNLLYSFA